MECRGGFETRPYKNTLVLNGVANDACIVIGWFISRFCGGSSLTINFTLNGVPRNVASVAPTKTVLEYLREDEALTGTKEGCAEGDCGACSVVLVRNGTDQRVAVNSCLLTLGQLDGAELITVEGLSERDGELEAVQQAIVTEDGTQCGFCTPGFVIALHALRHSGETVTDEVIHDALAGNLCRCTGYRSIVDAARAACAQPATDATAPADATPEEIHEIGDQKFLAPRTLSRTDGRTHGLSGCATTLGRDGSGAVLQQGPGTFSGDDLHPERDRVTRDRGHNRGFDHRRGGDLHRSAPAH